MKVTFNYRKGAYSVYMCFYLLALQIYPTLISAGDWVALAHLPVAVYHIFIHRVVVGAVVTAERTLGAGLTLMSLYLLTLKVLETAGTRNCYKRTANKLLARFWI